MNKSSDQTRLVRVDQWLWAVRICKTRKDAVDLCKRGKVTIDGLVVKSSRNVRVGQQVVVRRDNIDWTYEILNCIDKRVGAKIVSEHRLDKTSQEEIDKLKTIKSGWTPRRAKGEGRPTKKDRRALDQLFG